ncbi:MAG: oligosaccharide flippase family protein [Deltaproteobacteria bacterium]|nr:oligosaccharide flippase family protein [Deltaproteobacteria bacterium]
MAETNKIAGVISGLPKFIRQGLRNRMIKDAGHLAGSQYVATGLSFFTTLAAARILGSATYGIAAMVTAYPVLLWSFAAVKSVSVTTRYIAGFRATGQSEQIRSICKLGYGLDLLVSVIAFLLVSATASWVASSIMGLPENTWLMVVYAASFPFYSLIGTSTAIFSAWEKFRWLAVFQVLDKGMTLIAVIGLLSFGYGVSAVVLGTAVGNIITGLAMVGGATYTLYLEGIGPWWKSGLSRVLPMRKELSAFFGWNYVLITLTGFVGQLPLIVLGHLRGPEEAGFYRLATTLVATGSFLEFALGRVVYPVLSVRWGEGERDALISLIRRWTFGWGFPLGLLILVTIPLLPVFVPLFLGHAYRPMVFGTQLMMLGAAVSAVFFWLTAFYYASGQFGFFTKAYAFYTLFVIGLAWYGARNWGFSGLAGIITVGRALFVLLMVSTASRVEAQSFNVEKQVVGNSVKI